MAQKCIRVRWLTLGWTHGETWFTQGIHANHTRLTLTTLLLAAPVVLSYLMKAIAITITITAPTINMLTRPTSISMLPRSLMEQSLEVLEYTTTFTSHAQVEIAVTSTRL